MTTDFERLRQEGRLEAVYDQLWEAYQKSQVQVMELRQRLQYTLIDLLAIGGMYWNGLPQLPPVKVEP